MTKYLWNFIDTSVSVQKQWKVKLFLFLHILCFTLLSFMAELLFCSLLGAAFINQHIVTMSVLPLYVGLFIGLYGGIIFLMKHTNF